MISIRTLFIGLILLTLLSFALTLHSGSLHLDYTSIAKALMKTGPHVEQQIIWSIRLPLATTAFIAGGLLSLAGALMQVLLRNPLADPYVLGVSGGAAVASLAAILLGFSLYWQTLSSLLGALIAIALLYAIASRRPAFSSEHLLLTGIILAAGWGALISFILTISPDQRLHNLLYWLMGDIESQPLSWIAAVVLLLGLLYALLLARSLNILIQGDLQAQSLGVHCRRLRIQLFFLSAILTATAVSMVGCIGFIGLVVPHMIRLMIGSDHRYVLPTSVLLGGSLLMLAASLARSLIAPTQLPVGIITALLGIPIFLFLLLRQTHPNE